MNPKNTENELLTFHRDIDASESRNNVHALPYKVLIVDDEEEVHQLTRLVLKDFSFEGRGLEFLNAYSAEDAKYLLRAHTDISLILLDVVMEADNAGLQLVHFIREEIHNKLIRIILRTGQPGVAPERDIISNYDINDYKEKTELTSSKLFTSLTAALRSYRDLVTIDNSRNGLRSVIEATSTLFHPKSVLAFAEDILQQFQMLFEVNGESAFLYAVALPGVIDYTVEFAAGRLSETRGKVLTNVLAKSSLEMIAQAQEIKDVLINDNIFIGYFETTNCNKNIFYLENKEDFKAIEKDIIDLFFKNIAIAFDNLTLNIEIAETQKSVVYMLGEAVEKRSHETGSHVKRMTDISCMLAKVLEFSEQDIEHILIGAPLHDIGKIAIADSILHKPGKLTSEEFDIMKTHTTEGYNILKSSSRPALQVAATIAYQHHERWNGKGYPKGLSGEDIHPSARIVALADVVDALGHKRCYKDAWTLEEIIDLVKSERGEHFEPRVVDAFMDNIELYENMYRTNE